MVLDRFFTPKTKHADAAVREAAVDVLDAGDPELDRLAREDPASAVRKAAVARVIDLDLLRVLAEPGDADEVAAVARRRLCRLVCHAQTPGPDPAARRAALTAGMPLDDRLAVVCEADDAGLRLAALSTLSDAECQTDPVQAALESVAIDDGAAELRLAAATRVVDADRLERVATGSRGRDKRVHRHARERLRTLRAETDHAARIESLADRATALADGVRAAGSAGPEALGLLASLRQDWASQVDTGFDVNPVCRETFDAAVGAVEAVVADVQARRASIAAVLADLAALEKSLRSAPVVAGDDVHAQFDEVLADLDTRWRAAGGPGTDEARPYEQGVASVYALQTAWRRDLERRAALDAVLDDAEALLAEGVGLARDAVTRFEKRFSAGKLPGDETAAEALRQRFHALRDRMTDRLSRQRDSRERRLDEIDGLLGTMEAGLESGRLAEAISAHDKAKHRLKARDLPKSRVAKLTARLHAHESRIAELRKWRHFGTDVARERLCDDAESLAAAGLAPARVADRVRALRKKWQALDRTDGPATPALWQRFDAACETAYAPAQAHFDAQAKSRDQNLAKRVALCERLERLRDSTDWSAPDWRATVSEMRDIEQAYRKTGPVDRRKQGRVDKRFRRVRAEIDQCLDVEREHEIRRRRGVIRMIEGHAANDDLRAAGQAVRDARRSWAPTVGAARDVERTLWTEFCAACDVIEKRIEQNRSDDKRALDDSVTRREAVLTELAAVATDCDALDPADDEFARHLNQLQGRLDAARGAWDDGGELPKKLATRLEKRYSRAVDAAVAAVARQRHRVRDRALDGLHTRAAICDTLERAALETGLSADIDAMLADAQSRWAAAGPVDRQHAEPIEARFAAASAALRDECNAREALTEALDDNTETRRALCLELEVLAGIDSPPDEANARMAMRVAQLGNALASGSAGDTAARRRHIERTWAACGPARPNAAEALDARFRRALSAARG